MILRSCARHGTHLLPRDQEARYRRSDREEAMRFELELRVRDAVGDGAVVHHNVQRDHLRRRATACGLSAFIRTFLKRSQPSCTLRTIFTDPSEWQSSETPPDHPGRSAAKAVYLSLSWPATVSTIACCRCDGCCGGDDIQRATIVVAAVACAFDADVE